MSIWFRSRVEKRSATQFAPTPYPALAPTSYLDVGLSNSETALQSVAVRSTVDLIASLASEMPMAVYSGEGKDRQRRVTPSYLLDPAGDGNGRADWCYQLLMSWLLRGNAYGDILDTSRTGTPTQVALHHPDEVSGWLEDGRPVWTVAGRRVAEPARFWHQRVNPVPGRVLGLSPIAFHATTIGLSITSTRFGEQWFRDGAHPSAMLTNELAEIDQPQAQVIKDRFLAALRGTREPVVLGKGWQYKAIQINPEESQFLKTQAYTEAQCCRIFGPGFAEVLGYESGGSMTYANVESRAVILLVHSLDKWLCRLERAFSEMLPRPQYVHLDRSSLLRTTTLDRYRAHQLSLAGQWRTPNEIRALENLPPVSWGDAPIMTTAASEPSETSEGDGKP